MTKIVHDDLTRLAPRFQSQVFTYEMPIPPSVNAMYMGTRGGGKRLTPSAERFFNSQRQLVRSEVMRQKWKIEELGVWFEVRCDFYMGDKRIRDTHNCLKIMLDIFEGIVFQNDYYVKPHIDKVEYDKLNPRVVIRIYPEKYISRRKKEISLN